MTYKLNKGEYLQITQPQELTGSPILSTKPVGVFGASTCMTVPTGKNDCDSAQQQLAPVKALGSEYAAVRYRSRSVVEETPPWRIVGAVDGTTLTWTPKAPMGAPDKIDLGQVVEFPAAGPFVVASQDADHPFYLGGYMTGGEDFGGEGDPDWVNIIPPSQYLNHYVLFTDPTYPETSLVVVRTPSKLDKTKFADVTLACGGILTGWEKVGDYEYARVELVTKDFMGVNGCTNGRQEMSSDLPFGVTVWGWGNTQQTKLVSYAYPAGAGFQPINKVVVPHPAVGNKEFPRCFDSPLRGARGALTALLAASTIGLVPAAVRAQTSTFTVDRLNIAGAPDDGIGVWRPEVGKDTRFFGQLGLGLAVNPLRVDNYVDDLNKAEKIAGPPLSSQFITYLTAGVELFNRASIQVSLPLILNQAGSPTNNIDAGLPQPPVDLRSAAPMDMRLEGRFIVYRNEAKTFKLALSAAAFLPTGNKLSFAGTGAPARRSASPPSTRRNRSSWCSTRPIGSVPLPTSTSSTSPTRWSMPSAATCLSAKAPSASAPSSSGPSARARATLAISTRPRSSGT